MFIRDDSGNDRKSNSRPLTGGMAVLKRLSHTVSTTMNPAQPQRSAAKIDSIKRSSYQTTARKRTFDERGDFIRTNNNFDLAAADETFNVVNSLAMNKAKPRIKSATIRTGANI